MATDNCVPHSRFSAVSKENLLRRGVQEGVFRSDLDVPVAVAALESVFTSGKLVELAGQRSYRHAADDVADFFLHAFSKK